MSLKCNFVAKSRYLGNQYCSWLTEMDGYSKRNEIVKNKGSCSHAWGWVHYLLRNQ
jgi:hypothetical protein